MKIFFRKEQTFELIWHTEKGNAVQLAHVANTENKPETDNV